MSKICPICGLENIDEANVCVNCGAKFQEIKPERTIMPEHQTNESTTPQYYGQSQQYTPKQSSNKMRILIAFIAIGVVISLLLVVFLNPLNTSQTLEVYTGSGPKVSLQSLTNGNAMAIPELGHTAVYGYYIAGTRIGEISYTTEDEITYQGEECLKITGVGSFNMDMYGYQMDFSYDYISYVSKSDYRLVYSEYNYEYTEPSTMEMTMIMSADKESGEITITTNGIDTVMKMPEEYWQLSDLSNNIYVGYEKDLTYTTESQGMETEVNMKISVKEKEDVTVKLGTFLDCYQIEIETEQNGITSTTTLWVNEEGITPKMEVDTGSGSVISMKIVFKLENYT